MTTPESLADKLTRLASEVKDGFIVELGAYHGKGTIALAKEAKVRIYTIDDFEEKHGWIGERYGPEDEEVFWDNINNAGLENEIVHVKMPFEEAAEQWQWDIGLLYWDPGVIGRFRQDFLDWSYFVIPGGLFIAKDTTSGHLGSFGMINEAVRSGDWVKEDYWQGVTFLRRIR